MNDHYEKWDEYAPRGLILIGLGLSVLGEAITSKGKGRSFIIWFLQGLIGLVAFNSGIAVFGEAVKHRTLYELEVKRLREQ